MASRRALIIGAPDEKIPGVNIDIANLRNYFKSPIGGLWNDSELVTLISPTAYKINSEIQLLKDKDYSLIFFAGHGYHSNHKNRTILHINSSETMDSIDLRVGAQKHSLILDCCRVRVEDRRFLKSVMESMTFDAAQRQTLTPGECRRYFDKAISECANGIVVMNSCSINETAGESASEGGYYTSSLIEAANDWAKRKLMGIDLTSNYATYSTQECHDAASEQVKKLSGNRQNPNFDAPRVDKKFPFAVVA